MPQIANSEHVRRRLLLICVLAAALVLPAPATRALTLPLTAPADLAGYVDPMIGTLPVGFTFPGPSVPFGMVQNSPDTTGEFAYSGYAWNDALIRGFSLVHLNGPGVKKGGDIPLMPVAGPVVSSNLNTYASTFDHATEAASPGAYEVLLQRGGIRSS